MMFGADTSLVFDALQMVGIAAVATGGAVWLLMRKRKSGEVAETLVSLRNNAGAGDLEERVRVLERIATDSSVDLADEIEALRKPADVQTKQFEANELEGNGR